MKSLEPSLHGEKHSTNKEIDKLIKGVINPLIEENNQLKKRFDLLVKNLYNNDVIHGII